MGIEPTTYSLGSCRSTTELRPRSQRDAASASAALLGRRPMRRWTDLPASVRRLAELAESAGRTEPRLQGCKVVNAIVYPVAGPGSQGG